MNETTDTISPVTPTAEVPESDTAPELVSELLVEEISIDGMCGVY